MLRSVSIGVLQSKKSDDPICSCPLPMFVVYFLSNNHVNDLISSRVDPSEEELVAYYISFLKTLSMYG